MIFVLLTTLATSAYCDFSQGYANPVSLNSIAPASAPYGAPVPVAPQPVPVPQPMPAMPHQQIPVVTQPVGLPMGYSMYTNVPNQLGQSPYQLYSGQQPLPNSLYVNYPQGILIQPPQHSAIQPAPQVQPAQQVQAARQTQATQQVQTTEQPTVTSYLSSPYGYAAPHPTVSHRAPVPESAEEAPTVNTLPAPTNTPIAAPTPTAASTDPWAALATLTTKKTEIRRNKDGDNL
ncbi:hypothetical protein Q1695_003780 [Nippostrongylus brasiliensis]|nr:hypothetical protein Q1695_003780 [Nippostrongylus brasiliensis]